MDPAEIGGSERGQPFQMDVTLSRANTALTDRITFPSTALTGKGLSLLGST
ncbi:hypothetical protein [Antarcticimicrobium sediminis]|uniref:hypothetical protein n=1 Tax=Antarcticimicrobium sediminis TaxID=2546227 RepID=UPI0014050952|nr:hypothetical protein [Antarcticimicrobium sediminis]